MNIFANYSTRKILILIFFVALIIRLAFGIYMFQKEGTSNFVDDWDYISYANNILSQGIWVPDISKLYSNSHLVGPGFPLIVAISFAIFGENFLPIIILNAIISSLIPILIFKLGKEIFNERVGFISSIWSTFYVLHIRYIPTLLKEVWLAFLFLLIIYLFIVETKKNKIFWSNLILPIPYAFLIHIDERFFTYFPVLIIAFLFLDIKSWRFGFKKSALFLVVVLFLMIPWLVRNYYVYDRPVILTERTARFTDKIFRYDNQLKEHEKEMNQYPQFEWDKSMVEPILANEEIPGLKGHRYKSLQRGLQHGFIPHRYSKYERWYAEFKEFWRPVRFTGGYVGNGFRFEGPSWSLKHNLSQGLTYGLLLPFFLIGIFYIIKLQHKYGLLLTIIIFIHMIIHVVLAHVRNRYRIPIDAFIIIIAFYGIYQMYLKIKGRTIIERSQPSRI